MTRRLAAPCHHEKEEIKEANVKKICLGKCQKYMERPPEHIFPTSWYDNPMNGLKKTD